MATDREAWVEEKVRSQIARSRWLINLRWAGLAGVALTGAATQVAGYTVLLNPGWLVAPVALAYNALFLLWIQQIQRAYQSGRSPLQRLQRSLYWETYLQALCDVVALYLVIYLNGGVECPIMYIPLLAVMLSSVILPRSGIFLQANLGAALFALMALAEFMGWIPHIRFIQQGYELGSYRQAPAVLSAVLSMFAVMNLTAYIMSSLGQQLNRAEWRIRHVLGRLRQQVREAAGQLAASAGSLRYSAEEVDQVAGQIATTVQHIAQGAGQQAGQLEHLSQSLEHLAEAGRSVVEGSQETHRASAEAVSTAERGRQAADEATNRMEEITRVFSVAEEALDDLARHSEQIAEVAAAIDRFAERTDLLALNAGIEAARAGEHGRGFAVVAGEVKKLAASSSASAEQVAELVAQIQAEISGVVRSARAGRERVQRGQDAIATLEEVLEGMSTVIAQTDDLAGTTEHLSRQQREAHQEIARAVEEIACAAEETAAGAEETAAAVEQQVASFSEFGQAIQELATLASELDTAVSGLSEEQ